MGSGHLAPEHCSTPVTPEVPPTPDSARLAALHHPLHWVLGAPHSATSCAPLTSPRTRRPGHAPPLLPLTLPQDPELSLLLPFTCAGNTLNSKAQRFGGRRPERLVCSVFCPVTYLPGTVSTGPGAWEQEEVPGGRTGIGGTPVQPDMHAFPALPTVLSTLALSRPCLVEQPFLARHRGRQKWGPHAVPSPGRWLVARL